MNILSYNVGYIKQIKKFLILFRKIKNGNKEEVIYVGDSIKMIIKELANLMV